MNGFVEPLSSCAMIDGADVKEDGFDCVRGVDWPLLAREWVV